jgi:hypothetical protein
MLRLLSRYDDFAHSVPPTVEEFRNENPEVPIFVEIIYGARFRIRENQLAPQFSR